MLAAAVAAGVRHVVDLMEKRFSEFTDKAIVDARTSTEAIFASSAESREEVDQLVSTALANGGSKAQEAPQDHGFMYGNSFRDVDGHDWEVRWMDMSAVPRS